MTRVVAVSSEPGIRRRWCDALVAAGICCTPMAPGRLSADTGLDGAICLFDLGPRAGMGAQRLADGLAAHPDTRFVAMTARPEASEGLRLLRGGVRGYCNRQASPRVLSALLATVGAGEIWAGRQVTDYLLQSRLEQEVTAAEPGGDPLRLLTPREAEIAHQVAAGLSNKVIAADNGITERTVKAHLNSIFRKTGVHNRVQLALVVSKLPVASRRRSNG